MTKEFTDLLESEVLGPDVRTALKEAFDQKVKQMEQNLQNDYAVRYKNDKNQILEAMDNMIQDRLMEEIKDFKIDRDAVIKARVELGEKNLNLKNAYDKKFKKFSTFLEQKLDSQLRKEITEFHKDKRQFEKQRRQMANEVKEIQKKSKDDVKKKIDKLEEFVLKNLSEEIAVLVHEKKALVEQRTKLAENGKRELNEAKQNFIRKTAKMVDHTLTEAIKNEFVTWREDIKIARENNFGRKIFEAVASEYMASYLSEGSEVKNLQKKLNEAKQNEQKLLAEINKKTQLIESTNRNLNEIKDKNQRLHTLNSLLKPLTGDKKMVMEQMLMDVKTDDLRSAFDRYLPTVLGSQKRMAVNESRFNEPRREEFTGDRRVITPTQTINTDTSGEDVSRILVLAGLKQS